MSKFLSIVIICFLLTTASVFAQYDSTDKEKESNKKSNVFFNVAARYYPTCTTSANECFRHNNLWLEGNVFAFPYKDGYRWKGTFEWFGAGHRPHCNNSAVTMKHSVLAGRIGYDLSKSTYVTLSYKRNHYNFNIAGVGLGTGSWRGFGVGIDKKWKLGRKWDLHTNAHFYPRLDGPQNWDYRAFEYEIGGVYRMRNAVNIDFGYRGERGCGRNNAVGTCYCVKGPYIGISKEF